MAESSLRAARPTRKGGLPNALFVVAAVERMPPELRETAADVTIAFPWGSLLRGALAREDAVAASAGIASVIAPAGSIRATVSIDPRDGLDLPPVDDVALDELARGWSRHGVCVANWIPATDAEIAATGSTWARRLRAGRDRAVWRLELVRRAPAESPKDRRALSGSALASGR
jgi:16S rRNA (adenine(1408)-N(1))-methyltransferase